MWGWMGEAEVTAFLNHLAAERHVAAATQNQALSAILFLYREVLGRELPWLDGVQRPTRPPRLPVVLTRAEVERLLAQLTGTRWLIASLLYGVGLRVMECPRPRVKDVDLSYRQVLVRDGKGEKDRVTMLPEKLVEPVRAHLGRARLLHARDLREGYGEVHPALPVRVGPAAGDQGGGARLRGRQAGDLPHAAPLVRHASPRARLRHPHGAGAARALRRVDHDGVHARHEPRRARGEKPARPAGVARGALCRLRDRRRRCNRSVTFRPFSPLPPWPVSRGWERSSICRNLAA